NKKAYDIIANTSNLSTINLSKDVKLYKCLLKLTSECPDCLTNKCPGGYNCKNGAIDSKHVVCASDLKWGTCSNSACQYIHLTHRGLIPYSTQRKGRIDKDPFIKPHTKSNLQGILLTEQTIKAMINNEPIPAPSMELDSQ